MFKGYFHVADIFPTLASAAGIKIGQVDGIDQWNILVNGGKPLRKEVVMVLDNYDGYSGLISDEWKLVNGTVKRFNGNYDTFLGDVEEFSTPASYSQSVLNSYTGKALTCMTKNKLRKKNIENLRQEATITCNVDENPVNACNLLEKPCLFNIVKDPCERTNLAENKPEIMKKMLQRLDELTKSAVPSRRTFQSDPNCDPDFHNGTWSSWIPDNKF